MKRPLFIIGTSYFLATWAASISEASAIKLAALSALIGALFILARERSRRFAAAALAFFCAAAAFAAFWIHNERQIAPIRSLAGRSAVIEGIISEADSGPYASYTMSASFPEYPGLGNNIPLLVRTYGGTEFIEGDTVRVRLRLKPAPESLWHKSRGIYLIGQGIYDQERIPAGIYRFQRAAIRLRGIMSRNVYASLPEESADVVTAMVLGLNNNISPEIYSAVTKSGASHLLSVSGLHLAILSAFVLSALKAAGCSDRLSGVIAILLSFMFVALIGFPSAALRAFIMISIALSGRIISRRGDSMTSLGLAMLLCCVFRPHWSLSWSLWLSAGSTLGIIMFGSRLTDIIYSHVSRGRTDSGKLPKAIANALGLSISAYTFTVPVLLLMSGWISLISPLSNILISPFVPASILGGIMCAVIPRVPVLTDIITPVTNFSTWMIVRVSEILGSLPFAIIAIDEAWLLLWLLLLCASAAAMIIHRSKKLAAYAVSLLVLSFSVGSLSLDAANRNKVELITFSTRNAAVILRGNEAAILGLPDMYEISNLLRYLDYRGVRKLSAVIAPDSGEAPGSGILRLTGLYDMDCVIAPNDAYITEVLARALPDTRVYSGGYAEITVLGGVRIATDLQNENIYIAIGKNRIVKIREECDIIESEDGWIRIYENGTLLLPEHVSASFEPVGAHLFGESRVILDI